MSSSAWTYRIPVLLLNVIALSCASAPPETPIEMAVEWGLTGTSLLPDEVVSIQLVTCVDDELPCDENICTVSRLTLEDGVEAPNCRPAEGTEMFGDAPVLVRRGLPVAVPGGPSPSVRFELRGLDESNAVAFVGHAGPFVLGEGERRTAVIRMYEVGQSTPLVGVQVERFLHTATYLPDGRVLVAGGFDRVQTLATCPAALMLPEEARCFGLTATDQALAFDVSSGTLETIRGAMLAPRAGHTATALPDGRVLIAGGAAGATLAMVPEGAAAVGGYRFEIFPLQADGLAGADATFELFDAYLDGFAQDTERDGDLGRGRFIGTAGTASPGALNLPRFMHAAAQVPSTPQRVLLVGGLGSTFSAASYEVFDAGKAGGFGVYQADGNMLTTPRAMPGAVGLEGEVWIFGGTSAGSNDHLAEIWEAPTEGEPNGAVTLATDRGDFPSSMSGTEQERPEYALLRPVVAGIDGDQRALVVGWYGAHCEAGTSAPRFVDEAVPTELCNSPTPPATRSMTVTAATGITIPTVVRAHAFGALAVLQDFQGDGDRRFAVTGGIANEIWTATPAIDVFTGEVDASSSAATTVNGLSVSLAGQRLFHTSTGVPGYGLVTLGGMIFSTSVDRVTFQDDAEVLFLPL